MDTLKASEQNTGSQNTETLCRADRFQDERLFPEILDELRFVSVPQMLLHLTATRVESSECVSMFYWFCAALRA